MSAAAEGFVLDVLLGPASLLAVSMVSRWLAPFCWVASAGAVFWGIHLVARPIVWGIADAVLAADAVTGPGATRRNVRRRVTLAGA